MKKILILILVMVSINCFSQKDNIYIETLERFTTLLDTEYNWRSDKIYFEEVFGITDYFSSVVGNYNIVVLNTQEIEKALEVNNSIYIYRFFPLITKNGIFSIEISGSSYNKNGTIIADSGYRYNYTYDCNEKKFYFLKLDGGGI